MFFFIKSKKVSWEMKLGANWGLYENKHKCELLSMDALLVANTHDDERKPWKVSKLQRQGLVSMLIFQAHLPTNMCS